jgi:hypothetical protein
VRAGRGYAAFIAFAVMRQRDFVIGRRIMWPSHYRQFVERNRLAGAEVEVPEGDDLSGIGSSIQLFDEAAAIAEADFYPGIVVKDDGFVPIGGDPTGSGDPYFINTSDDPPGAVYRIYHDMVSDSSYNRNEAIARILVCYEELLRYVDA